MTFTLPQLPYSYTALEPYVDGRTMEIHHTKHHQAYIDKLNTALDQHPEFKAQSIEGLLANLDTLPENIRTVVRNNGGGHYNHALFWQWMTPDSPKTPSGNLLEAINKTFENFDKFKELFANAAITRFGSGWAWLSQDNSGQLIIHSTANQDSPIMEGKKALLGIDIWEHAYYLNYQNRRPDYITAWWNIVNWAEIEKNFSG